MKRLLCLTLLGSYVAGCQLAQKGVDRLIQPNRYDLGKDIQAVVDRPATWGLKLEAFSATTPDGLVLPGYLVNAAGPGNAREPMHSTLAKRGLARERFRGTLVVLHGINSRKEHMLEARMAM